MESTSVPIVAVTRVLEILSKSSALAWALPLVLATTGLLGWVGVHALPSVTLLSSDDLFGYMLANLALRRRLRSSRTLTVSTTQKVVDMRRWTPVGDRISYDEATGTTVFVEDWNVFVVRRSRTGGDSWQSGFYLPKEEMTIYHIGLGFGPIRTLLQKVYSGGQNDRHTSVVVFRPTPTHDSWQWSQMATKSCRAMETVFLDPEQKQNLLNDVEGYLNDRSRAFYGRHGIPYRRGYLFHGPPGCGKTSTVLALASTFQLDIYIITLAGQELRDSDLCSLAQHVPAKAILLLEDVDTIGLPRDHASPTARSMAGPIGPRSTATSLAGLLDAIDGTTSPEGQLTIMSTNKPNTLDSALIRPGRVDCKVEFGHATSEQAGGMFRSIYGDVEAFPIAEKEDGQRDLETWAEEFADQVPTQVHSPAALQNFLLAHRANPREAVRGIAAWSRRELAAAGDAGEAATTLDDLAAS